MNRNCITTFLWKLGFDIHHKVMIHVGWSRMLVRPCSYAVHRCKGTIFRLVFVDSPLWDKCRPFLYQDYTALCIWWFEYYIFLVFGLLYCNLLYPSLCGKVMFKCKYMNFGYRNLQVDPSLISLFYISCWPHKSWSVHLSVDDYPCTSYMIFFHLDFTLIFMKLVTSEIWLFSPVSSCYCVRRALAQQIFSFSESGP